jgi:hypothetical protein
MGPSADAVTGQPAEGPIRPVRLTVPRALDD